MQNRQTFRKILDVLDRGGFHVHAVQIRAALEDTKRVPDKQVDQIMDGIREAVGAPRYPAPVPLTQGAGAGSAEPHGFRESEPRYGQGTVGGGNSEKPSDPLSGDAGRPEPAPDAPKVEPPSGSAEPLPDKQPEREPEPQPQ